MRRTFLLIITVFLLFTGCKQTQASYDAQFLLLFDTVTQIVGYADSKETFTVTAQIFRDRIERYHQLFDIYHEYDGLNNLSTINKNAGIKPTQVDREIIDLLLYCKSMYIQTQGRVNVAMGSILSVWHAYRENGINDPEHAVLPPMEVLKEASTHTDIDQLIIDEESCTVYLADPKMSLDVGAIAKGYTAQKVADSMRKDGYTPFLLSIGGNVYAVGEKGKGIPWNIGVQNPDTESEQRLIAHLGLKDRCMVTSGDYQRYYTVDGQRYNHIIDPKTLMPAMYYAAVVVVCNDSALADAYSTALFCMPVEQAMVLAEQTEGMEVMFVLKDEQVVQTQGFKALLL